MPNPSAIRVHATSPSATVGRRQLPLALLHVDQTERSIVEHDGDDGQPFADGRQQFARAHQQPAVAGQRKIGAARANSAAPGTWRPASAGLRSITPRRSPPAARTPSSTTRSRSTSGSARAFHSIVAGSMCAPASTVTRARLRRRAPRFAPHDARTDSKTAGTLPCAARRPCGRSHRDPTPDCGSPPSTCASAAGTSPTSCETNGT